MSYTPGPPPGQVPPAGFPLPPGFSGAGYPQPLVQVQQTDNKAVLSLVLGILSLTCTMGLTGIPAIIVGLLSKKEIRESGGALGGGGLALGGIITGALGTLTMIGTALIYAGIFAYALASPHTFAPLPSPAPAPPPALVAPPPAGPPEAPARYGEIDVIDLDPEEGPLRGQLADAVADAHAAKSMLIVQTTAKWCAPCKKFDASLADARMQTALKGVTLVRVDIDEFERADLKDLKLDMGSIPWFFKVDSALKPIDAISSGEWDDDVPENIAPILRAFVQGKLKKRRHTAPMGTPM